MSPAEHEIMRAVEDAYWWYQALRQHVVNCIRPASPRFRLLDAGCGTGGMLAKVRARFREAELAGIDVSARAVELTNERKTGADVLQGSVNELPFDSDSFNYVLSIDVITAGEVDDGRAVAEMFRVLKPGGTLLLNVAAFRFLAGAHDDATDVTRRYTRGELRALLVRAGFVVRSISYWNALLLPAVAVWRLTSRGGAARSDFTPMPAAANALLRGIASFELALSRAIPLPFGTSLFAIATK